jgi:hypothetical protein
LKRKKYGKCVARLKHFVRKFIEKKKNKMEFLEGGGMPVLYIGLTVPKG